MLRLLHDSVAASLSYAEATKPETSSDESTGDSEESREVDVTVLFDLSRCHLLSRPSSSSDVSETSVMMPLSEARLTCLVAFGDA